MHDNFNWGLSAGLAVGNLIFWWALVPWVENRVPGEHDFFKGFVMGTFIVFLVLPGLKFLHG